MSSRSKNSLIHLRELNQKQILHLFSEAEQISRGEFSALKGGQTAGLIFLESSTRTRLSFETACARLNVHPLLLDAKSGTSLEKGETPEDTVLNIAAMKPGVLIIRCGDNVDVEGLLGQVECPILNAGWGKKGHPTQALLDAYTIWRKRQKIEGEKVLIIGDVRHSRVAASHFELAKILNYEVALCGPTEFLPEKSDHKVFAKLQEGLQWATVAMALRVQNERHSGSHGLSDYPSQYGLNRETAKWISPNILIMHPGPINHGMEMDMEMIRDSRSVILEQVTNGVYIRQALVHRALREGVL